MGSASQKMTSEFFLAALSSRRWMPNKERSVDANYTAQARTNHERNALVFGHALGDLLHLLLVLAGGLGLLLELLLRLLLVLAAA